MTSYEEQEKINDELDEITYQKYGETYQSLTPKERKEIFAEYLANKKRPHFIAEPFGLPRDLQSTGVYRRNYARKTNARRKRKTGKSSQAKW